MTTKILVSACLLGQPTRYNGQALPIPFELRPWLESNRLIPFCPEIAGGLSVPRIPAEIVGGDGEDVLSGKARVVDAQGRDVTEAYLRGAHAACVLARQTGAQAAILKAHSPSCGSRCIYDGTFSGTLRTGCGVTTALLRRQGLVILNEEMHDQIRALLSDETAPGGPESRPA